MDSDAITLRINSYKTKIIKTGKQIQQLEAEYKNKVTESQRLLDAAEVRLGSSKLMVLVLLPQYTITDNEFLSQEEAQLRIESAAVDQIRQEMERDFLEFRGKMVAYEAQIENLFGRLERLDPLHEWAMWSGDRDFE